MQASPVLMLHRPRFDFDKSSIHDGPRSFFCQFELFVHDSVLLLCTYSSASMSRMCSWIIIVVIINFVGMTSMNVLVRILRISYGFMTPGISLARFFAFIFHSLFERPSISPGLEPNDRAHDTPVSLTMPRSNRDDIRSRFVSCLTEMRCYIICIGI